MKKLFAFLGVTVLFFLSLSFMKKIVAGMKKSHYSKTVKTA